MRIIDWSSDVCSSDLSPLPFEAARANVDGLLALPHIRAAGESADFWLAFGQVSADVTLRGNLVPDAHLVALMRTHGVTHRWIRDRELRLLDGMTVTYQYDRRLFSGTQSRGLPSG